MRHLKLLLDELNVLQLLVLVPLVLLLLHGLIRCGRLWWSDADAHVLSLQGHIHGLSNQYLEQLGGHDRVDSIGIELVL